MARLVLGALIAFAVVQATSREQVSESVVFGSEREGNIDLYLSALDGTPPRRMTHSPEPDETPRCSPKGDQVSFVRGGFGPDGEIYTINLATGHERRLTNDHLRDSTPQWSADGTQIYFTKRVGTHDQIAVMGADGSNVRFLTDGGQWHDTMPGVSPDGQRLVHHTYRYGDRPDYGNPTELHVIELATGVSWRLTNASGYDYEASFAGREQVIFSSNRAGGHYRVYVTPLKNSVEARLLADVGADAWGPRHSPISNRVLFHTGKRGAWRMMTIDLSGGRPVPLLDDGFSNAGGDWCR